MVTSCVLVPGERSGTGRDIVMTQQDVNEIQLAKGAIATGLETLLDSHAHADPKKSKKSSSPGRLDRISIWTARSTSACCRVCRMRSTRKWAMRRASAQRWRCCR